VQELQVKEIQEEDLMVLGLLGLDVLVAVALAL
jgi:hypothetical protein